MPVNFRRQTCVSVPCHVLDFVFCDLFFNFLHVYIFFSCFVPVIIFLKSSDFGWEGTKFQPLEALQKSISSLLVQNVRVFSVFRELLLLVSVSRSSAASNRRVRVPPFLIRRRFKHFRSQCTEIRHLEFFPLIGFAISLEKF